MALVKCGECGNEIAKTAPACPKCGAPNERASHLSGKAVLGALALTAFVIWWMANKDAGTGMPAALSIEGQVASDSVKQYEIAKRSGDKMQTCVQASLVTAAYLQANMEQEFNRWQAIEKADCKGVLP